MTRPFSYPFGGLRFSTTVLAAAEPVVSPAPLPEGEIYRLVLPGREAEDESSWVVRVDVTTPEPYVKGEVFLCTVP